MSSDMVRDGRRQRCLHCASIARWRSRTNGTSIFEFGCGRLTIRTSPSASWRRESQASLPYSPNAKRACLRCLAQGKSTRDIAKELDIGLTTVHTHLRRSREKLGLTSAEALIGFAAQILSTCPRRKHGMNLAAIAQAQRLERIKLACHWLCQWRSRPASGTGKASGTGGSMRPL